MAPYRSFLTTGILASSLIGQCIAGVMSPIVIINFSDQEVNLDFNSFPDNCIYYDFDPDNLYKYYSAYRSTDLVRDHGSDYKEVNSYLQAFKSYVGIDDLQSSLYGATGHYTLPAYSPGGKTPFSVHQIEMNGAGGCFGANSWKQFSISTSADFNVYELRDPHSSNWEITKFLANGPFTVDIGKGGYLGVGWTVGYGMLGAALAILAAAILVPVSAAVAVPTGIGGVAIWLLDDMSLTFIDRRDETAASGSSLMYARADSTALASATAGDVTLTQITTGEDGTPATYNLTVPHLAALEADGTPATWTSFPTYGFYDLYKRIEMDNRQACVLSKSAPMDQNCFVAGTAIIVQADGTTVAYPLPDVYQAW